jgi:hypothetical protein
VICDHTIALNGYLTRQHYPAHLRRIRFKDPETGKTLVFLTNQMTLPALTICALYKSRWQVELFFKWIKRIKSFCGAKPPRKLSWTDAGCGRTVVGYGDFTQDAGWRRQ